MKRIVLNIPFILGVMVAVAREKENLDHHFGYQDAVALMTNSWSKIHQAVAEQSKTRFRYDLVFAAVGNIGRIAQFIANESQSLPYLVDDAPFWYDVCDRVESLVMQLEYDDSSYDNAKRLLITMLLNIKKTFTLSSLEQLL